ncbi:MAG: hypothetical protein ABWJ42_02135 [Sulfolobales archaeon]
MRDSLKKISLSILLLASLISTLSPLIYNAQSVSFELKSVSFTNSAGYNQVYPGSRGATLTVFYRYTGSDRISSVAACLYNLPDFIQPRYSCSPARDLNNTYQPTVNPGDTIYFSYTIDVSRSASPGSYVLWLNITYTVTTTNQQSYYTSFVVIQIASYPPLNLSVVDSYLSPTAYPGTRSTSLYVVVENSGDSDISGGEAIIYLPAGFESSSNRISVPTINRGSRSTLILNNLGISPQTNPGTYQIRIDLSVTALTSDGVSYDATTSITVGVEIARAPQVNLDIVSFGWSSPRAPADSLGGVYTITFRNIDLATIYSIVAYLTLPECMSFSNGSKTSSVYLSRTINPGDSFDISFSGIKISRDCLEKTYRAYLEIEIYGSRHGSEFYSTQYYTLTITLTNPSLDLRVSHIFWRTNPVYPGSMNSQLVVVLDNRDYMDLSSVVALLETEDLYPRESYYQLQTISSGSRGVLTFQLSIPPTVRPGTHSARLTIDYIAASSQTSYIARSTWNVVYEIREPPKPLVEIIDYRWSSGVAYENSVRNSLQVIIRNNDIIPIQSMVLTLRTPENITISGRDMYTLTGGALQPGSTAQFTFNDIDVNVSPGVYFFTLYISGLAGSQNSEFWFNISYILSLEVSKPESRLELVDFGWSQATAYASMSRASVYALLRSYVKDTIVDLVAKLILLNARSSQGAREITTTYSGQINYGESIRLVFSYIELSERVLDAVLVVSVVVASGNTRYSFSESFKISLTTVSEKILEVSYVETLYQNTPAPLLVSANNVEIRVGFINSKPEALSSIKASIETPRGVTLRGVSGSCLNGVSSGGSCYLSLYVDLSSELSPGVYIINISLLEQKIVSNALLQHVENFSIPIQIEDPIEYTGVPKIATAFWGTTSPTPVFNYSKYTPLTIRLINVGRYNIQGLEVEARSRDIEFIKSSDVCSQMLAPGGYCTVTLYGNINTSKDYAIVRVFMSYISNTYGSFVVINRSEDLVLRIERNQDNETISGAVEYITSMWLEGSVEPNTMGAHLLIIFRNNYIESMRGVYLTIYLPEGFKSSYDNTSLIKLLPTSLSTQQLQLLSQQPLAYQLISQLTQLQQTPQQSFSKGDFLIFIAPLNIYDVSLGMHAAEAVLVYTDSVGTTRSYFTKILIPVIGSTKYLDVYMSSPLIVNESYENTTLYIFNRGSAPIYNVYIVLTPAYSPPIVIASPSVIYVDRIDPGVTISREIKIAYNPYATYQTEIKYGTTAILVSIIYRDPSGAQKSFNTTYAVIVEPFIKLYIQDLRAEYRGGTVQISGSLINLGSSTAQRVNVYACVDDVCRNSFVGDLDPASQSVFRVEIPVSSITKSYAELAVQYYDSYNILHTERYNVPIKIVSITTATTTSYGYAEFLDPYKIAIGAIVVSLVAIVLYLIYRSVSRKTSIEQTFSS